MQERRDGEGAEDAGQRHLPERGLRDRLPLGACCRPHLRRSPYCPAAAVHVRPCLELCAAARTLTCRSPADVLVGDDTADVGDIKRPRGVREILLAAGLRRVRRATTATPPSPSRTRSRRTSTRTPSRRSTCATARRAPRSCGREQPPGQPRAPEPTAGAAPQ